MPAPTTSGQCPEVSAASPSDSVHYIQDLYNRICAAETAATTLTARVTAAETAATALAARVTALEHP